MWATYTNNAQFRELWLPAMTVKWDTGQEFVTTQAVKEEEVCMSALQDSHAFFPPSLSQGLWSYLVFMTSKFALHTFSICIEYDIEFRKRMSRYPASMRWEIPDHHRKDKFC